MIPVGLLRLIGIAIVFYLVIFAVLALLGAI